MGFPGLNLPQQVAAPQGVQGGVVGPNPTALNRDPKADQIVKGLGQLMQGFVSSKEATKAHYGQLVDQSAQEIAAGLNPNPDYRKIAQWMRLSGRPYNTDLTPAQALAQTQTNQYQAAQDNYNSVQQSIAQGQQGAQQLASQTSGLPPLAPGPMGSPGQPGVAAPGIQGPGMPPSSAPAAAPPGFMDRLRLSVGMTPGDPNVARPSDQSPAIQNLRAVNAAAQTAGGAPGQIQRGLQDSVLASNMKQAAGKLGIAHDQSMTPVYSQIFGKALGGDLQANTMLQRLGVFKGVPVDEVAQLYKSENPGATDFDANQKAAKLLLWQQGGGPALQLKIADMAKDMIPRFGGDASKAMAYTMSLYSGQNTGLTPGRTPEEFQKYTEALDPLLKRYPNAPPNLIQMYADAKMQGNPVAGDVLDFISSHYKSEGQVSQGQFQQSLAKDYSQIASQNSLGEQRNQGEQLGYYTRAIETLESPYKEALKDPKVYADLTVEQRNGLQARLSDLNNQLAGTVVKINGKEQPLAPLESIMNSNNITTHWWGPGPLIPYNVRPTGAPAQGAPAMPYQPLSPQDQQLLGLPGAGGSSSSQPGLGQLLMNRALGQQ